MSLTRITESGATEQGFLRATPGSVIDYGYIEQHIADLAERYRVQVIVDSGTARRPPPGCRRPASTWSRWARATPA
jgi:hypothetical protein